jgi:hypothetical protein
MHLLLLPQPSPNWARHAALLLLHGYGPLH